jgi:hypothetical protein
MEGREYSEKKDSNTVEHYDGVYVYVEIMEYNILDNYNLPQCSRS